MKTRNANRIIKSVVMGDMIYPRHILRAACLRMEMDCVRIPARLSDVLFPINGIASAHPFIGNWIPEIIAELVGISRQIGVRIGTSEMNGTGALINPTDTADSAYKRWRRETFTDEQLAVIKDNSGRFYGEYW